MDLDAKQPSGCMIFENNLTSFLEQSHIFQYLKISLQQSKALLALELSLSLSVVTKTR